MMPDNHPPSVNSEITEREYLEIFDSFISYATVFTASLSSSSATDAIIDMDVDPPGPAIEAVPEPLSPPASEPGDVQSVYPDDALPAGPVVFTLPQDEPPSPPSSELEPGDDVPYNLTLAGILDNIEQETHLIVATNLGFGNLPINWRRVLFYAFNQLYSETVTIHIPRIDRKSLIPRAVTLARQRCEGINPLWAPEEDQMITINGEQVLSSTSSERFRVKLHSTIAKAETIFYDDSLRATIYLLVSQPDRPAMMPHLPGPPGTRYSHNQRMVVGWYLTWDDKFGYSMWHKYYDEELQWFDHGGFRNLLYSAFRDPGSPGFFGFQDAHQEEGGWTWRPSQARGVAISAVAFTLASVSVSMRIDFLQEDNWDQQEMCVRRRTAIEREQARIFHFLNMVTTSSIPDLSASELTRARNALFALLDELGFTSE